MQLNLETLVEISSALAKKYGIVFRTISFNVHPNFTSIFVHYSMSDDDDDGRICINESVNKFVKDVEQIDIFNMLSGVETSLKERLDKQSFERL